MDIINAKKMIDKKKYNDYDINNLLNASIFGFKYYFPSRYREHYIENEYEKFSSEIFLNFINEDSVVVDVGANLGYYSMLASTKNKDGETYSFEPVEENLQILRKNAEINHFSQIKSFKLAISDKKGKVDFHVAHASDSCGIYKHPNTETIEMREITMITLDDFFGNKRIDLVKIDTEGNELAVLRGMNGIIDNNKDIKLLIEFNPKCLNAAGITPGFFLREIDELGFSILLIDDDKRKFYQINDLTSWEKYLEKEKCCNLLCIKKDQFLLATFISHSSLRGGAELSLLELVKGNIKRGVMCHVILPADGYMLEELRKFPVSIDVAYLPWWTYVGEVEKENVLNDVLISSVDILKILIEANSDIVYTNTCVIPQGAIAAKCINIPHVWHINEFGERDHGLKFLLDFKKRANFIYNNSEKIVFNSKILKNFFDESIPSDKSSVSYYNVKLPDIEDKKNIYKYIDSLKLLLIGGINKGKGQLEAARAVKYCIEKYGDKIELAFFGRVSSKEYFDELQKYIIDNSLESTITFHEFVDNPTGVYASADVVLMCSHSEAFGRVTVEAMLMGKPVIGANAGATPEILDDNYSGLLYESGNYSDLGAKIHYLFNNKNKLNEFGVNAKKSVLEKFNDEGYAGYVSALLKELSKNSDIEGKKFSISRGFMEVARRQNEEMEKKNGIIREKELTIKKLGTNIAQKEEDISKIVNTFRWKIPNYFYKIYKKRVKKYVPVMFFRIGNYLVRFLNDLNKNIHLDQKKLNEWKRYFKYAKAKDKNSKILLFVDRGIPEQDKDAGSFIAFQYLKILTNLGFNIIFWPQDSISREPYANELRKMGIKIMLDNISPGYFVKIFGKYIDIAMLSRPAAGMSFIYDVKKYSDAKIIYIGHDLHFLREARGNKLNGEKEKQQSDIETKKIEFSIMKRSDISLFFSDKEVEIIKNDDPKIVAEIMPWIQESDNSKSTFDISKRNRIIFIGGFSHMPNLDAVKWFHEEIYPELKKKLENFRVSIIGSNVPEEIREFNDGTFDVVGFVEEDEIQKYFNEARVFVAPLRFGAGFKGKIAKAMSYGVPVVTTEIGAEGIGLKDDVTALISDDANEFAAKVISLFNDDEKWSKLSGNSSKLLKEKYSFENARVKIKKIFKSIGI